jgi:putative membrane protein
MIARKHVLLFVLLAIGALSAPAAAQTMPPAAPVTSPNAIGTAVAPATFATMAAQGNMAEIASAQLALQKSSNATVIAFAKRMIADHTKALNQLLAIMKTQGMAPPATVDAKQQGEMAKLQTLSGASFDSAYINGEIPDHQDMLALLAAQAASTANPSLAAWAKATAPTVESHLEMAKTDAKKLTS